VQKQSFEKNRKRRKRGSLDYVAGGLIERGSFNYPYLLISTTGFVDLNN